MKSLLGISLFCLGFATLAFGYTYRQVGVASNFLVEEGKVYFVQSDGRMTVLDVTSVTLERVDPGILVRGGAVSLLDPASLEPRWSIRASYRVEFTNDRLFIYEGNGVITCRSLQTADSLWTFNQSGALELVAENGKLLVFHEAKYLGPAGVPAVILLDLETGQELWRRTTPPKVHFLGAFFDGERIYLPAGSYEGAHTPNLTRYDAGRPSADFERMLVWDLLGNELESTPVSNAEVRTPDGADAFEFDGRVFARNRVWPTMDDLPAWHLGQGRRIDPEESGLEFAREARRFDRGPVSIVFASTGMMNDPPQVIVRAKDRAWTGTIPYLDPEDGEVAAVELSGDTLLLGSNLGHVEAVDRTTGRSKWMYLFPTMRHTMSSSSHSQPPMVAAAPSIPTASSAACGSLPGPASSFRSG